MTKATVAFPRTLVLPDVDSGTVAPVAAQAAQIQTRARAVVLR
jgi:hypothetical protein